MDAPLTWPERPTCHDNDYRTQAPFKFGESAWRPSGVRSFRSCTFCGSIHPEDLLTALRAGAKLEASDWKYGWPHKFYVNDIPNANAGNMVQTVSGSGPLPLTADERARFERCVRPGGRVEFTESEDRWHASVQEPDGATTMGKWYNLHLLELSPEAFDALAPLLSVGTGVEFTRDENGIKYRGVPSGG